MARKSETSEPIDGFRYKVRQMGATEGVETLTKITKLMLPSIGAVASKDTNLSQIMESDIGGEEIGNIAARLAANLAVDDVQEILKKLAFCTEIFGPGFGDGGAPLDVHFDDHFAGEYGAMIKWATFALKVNFGNFWSGLAVRGKKESESHQPQKPE
jgi:hypothetical protein